MLRFNSVVHESERERKRKGCTNGVKAERYDLDRDSFYVSINKSNQIKSKIKSVVHVYYAFTFHPISIETTIFSSN